MKSIKGTKASSLTSAVYQRPSWIRLSHSPFRAYASAAAQTPDIYDVVCIGGGLAGLTLLAALRTPFHSYHNNLTEQRLRLGN